MLYDVIIIGGGLSGLSSAYYLCAKDKKVLLLEGRAILGGRTASWYESDMQVESGLHRMLGFYEEFPALLEACDVDLAKTIIWEDEIEIRLPDNGPRAEFGLSLFHPLKTLSSIVGNNEFLTPQDKAQLVHFFTQGFLEVPKNPKKYDSLTLKFYAKSQKLSDEVIVRLLTPLTEGLFFIPPSQYSAYSFFALLAPYTTKLQKTRVGSFSAGMTDALANPIAKQIEKNGGNVLTNSRVEKISLRKDKNVDVHIPHGSYQARIVVIACGIKDAESLLKTTSELVPDAQRIQHLQTMPSVTFQAELTEPVLPVDRVTFSPSTIFASYSEQSHTTFKNTKGRISVILAESEKYITQTPEEIFKVILADAKRLDLPLTRKTTKNYHIVTWKNDFYSYAPGNTPFAPSPRTALPNIFLAGDYTNQPYLQTMEGAVFSGKRVADLIE